MSLRMESFSMMRPSRSLSFSRVRTCLPGAWSRNRLPRLMSCPPLDYLGLPPGSQVRGQSVLPALSEGKPVPSRFAYMETLYPKTGHGWSELRAVRLEGWKLVMRAGDRAL